MNQAILLALDAILGQRSAHSFATGPVIALPFISPLLLTITPALSSKYMNTPSFLRNGFRCLITTAGITCTNTIYKSEKSKNLMLNNFLIHYIRKTEYVNVYSCSLTIYRDNRLHIELFSCP